MANPELSRHIQALPDELNALEGGREISERLRRVDALKDRARSLEPLDGVEDMALADYDRDWLVRYTYNSNAIEGSTLTLEDTSLVLEGEFVPSDSRPDTCSQREGSLTAWLRARICQGGAEAERGADPSSTRGDRIGSPAVRPRHVPSLWLFGADHRHPSQDRGPAGDPRRPAILDRRVGWLRSASAAQAAGFHAMFENIHPFTDGNGRAGRQLLNFVLLRNGYRPVAIKYDAGRSYARGLEAWQVDGKPDSFCSIFLDCVEQEEQTLVDLIERLRHLR